MSLYLILLVINCFLIYRSLIRLSFFNPLKIWFIIQALFYVGTFYIIDVKETIHVKYFVLYSIFIFISCLIVFFTDKVFPNLKVKIEKKDIKFVYRSFYFSIFLSVLYFILAGSNLFLESIQAFFLYGEGVNDVANRRYDFYSGKNYYAPGFFNMFKNYLLPASFFSIILMHQKKIRRKSILFISISFLIFVSLILGTGQRGAFILSLVFGFIISYHFLGKKQTFKKFRLISIIFASLFILSTFFLGRSNVKNISTLDDFLNIAQTASDRFLVVNQLSGLNAFVYIEKNEKIQWGYDWLRSTEQILPGKSTYKNIANKVFKSLYGSDRGTSPPTIVGSIYYNFGVLGILIFPVIFVPIVHLLYKEFLKNYTSYKDLFIYLFLYFSISTWGTSGIDYPLRNGLVLYLFLIGLKKIKFK